MKSLLITLTLLFIGSSAYAIPASYGTAKHRTTKWQELATYDASNTLVDQYGTFWSTDGGVTWGREDLEVGQSVQFQFNMHKKNVGTHLSDHLKAWIDWDQNGSFEESEAIVYGQQFLPTDSSKLGTNLAPAAGEANFSFFSSTFTINETHLGDLWLRARVVCSESLNRSVGGKWKQQWDREDSFYNDVFKPTGKLYQGEVEEWKISVSQVPDTGSTLFMLGSVLGLVGFVKRRRSV